MSREFATVNYAIPLRISLRDKASGASWSTRSTAAVYKDFRPEIPVWTRRDDLTISSTLSLLQYTVVGCMIVDNMQDKAFFIV
jgi:hypothetical protein